MSPVSGVAKCSSLRSSRSLALRRSQMCRGPAALVLHCSRMALKFPVQPVLLMAADSAILCVWRCEMQQPAQQAQSASHIRA